MPIEFFCPGCSKLLRTPDESAGKKAKCPQCATIVDVPATAGDKTTTPWPGGTPPPFVSPQPASSPFESGAPFVPPPKPSAAAESSPINPYATPTAAATFPAGESIEEMPRTGLPWERDAKSLRSFWETCKLILGSPTLAFGLMFREAGLRSPVTFLLLGGFIGGLFTGLYQTLMQLGLLSMVTAMAPPNAAGAMGGPQWIQVVIQFPMAIAAGTILALIGSFITAAIYHVVLMMLGGARFGYETTYRVVAYANGAIALVQIIPMCGQYAMGIMALVYSIIGLMNAHRISGGKAAGAVLLPLLLCCGAIIVTAVIAGIVVYAAAQS